MCNFLKLGFTIFCVCKLNKYDMLQHGANFYSLVAGFDPRTIRLNQPKAAVLPLSRHVN